MCRRVQLFLGSVLNTIVLVLNFNYAKGDRDWSNCNFGSTFCSFRQEKWIAVLFYWSEFKDRKELNICEPSIERVRTCKDYVIGREITTILKIAVDNVILQLCDSCDYFASPLLMEKKQLNLMVRFKKGSCCQYCYNRIVRIVHPHAHARIRQLRHRRFHNGYKWWCNKSS